MRKKTTRKDIMYMLILSNTEVLASVVLDKRCALCSSAIPEIGTHAELTGLIIGAKTVLMAEPKNLWNTCTPSQKPRTIIRIFMRASALSRSWVYDSQ